MHLLAEHALVLAEHICVFVDQTFTAPSTHSSLAGGARTLIGPHLVLPTACTSAVIPAVGSGLHYAAVGAPDTGLRPAPCCSQAGLGAMPHMNEIREDKANGEERKLVAFQVQ